eukprot:1821180-Pyramimonas_sp.AAC.1
MSRGKRAAPFSAAAVAAANRAAAREPREAPAAEPPRRPKVQRAAAIALQRASFSSPFTVTLGKRIAAWGIRQPPSAPELATRWAALT